MDTEGDMKEITIAISTAFQDSDATRAIEIAKALKISTGQSNSQDHIPIPRQPIRTDGSRSWIRDLLC
ncbi:MAG: hypothetical protein LBD60_01895 [Puniceicoccales bacterium]|nr:hypothetical protein [Puniceicoccales bacterium]